MDSDFSNSDQQKSSKFTEYVLKKNRTRQHERELLSNYLRAFRCSDREIKLVVEKTEERFGSIRTAVEYNYMGFFASGSMKADKLMHLLPPLSRRAGSTGSIITRQTFSGVDDCMTHIINALKCETDEIFYALYMNSRLQLQHHLRLTDAAYSQVDVCLRTLLTHCPNVNDCSMIVAHNHISNSPEPSTADISFTENLRSVCAETGINFIDHLVTYRNTGFSILSGKHYSV